MSESEAFVPFADVGDLATARVAAAVLADAGIEARVHDESLGPYPVTIGRMAITQLWVRPADHDEARVVMLEAEIEHTLGTEVRTGALANPGSLPMRLIAAGSLMLLVYGVVRGLLRVF